jgi:hypothetical protein
MAKVDTDKLTADADSAQALLEGYELINLSPKLSPEAHAELGEGIAKVSRRVGKLKAAVLALNDLFDDGYPDVSLEVANQSVIDEINAIVSGVVKVPGDFEAPQLLSDKLDVKVK